ncbi:MAG: NAD(P)-binding domain-containing protein, partial [bacterium]
GVLHGRATLVSPTKCIGHGACEAACPVDAISLVFGTERRGVELPFVKETFETNVPGIFIAGELGGMGLIRNAVTQGKQAVDCIGQTLNGKPGDVLDLAIIGAGPAGIAASLQAMEKKLSFVTLEQDTFGGTVLNYPRQKLVMTQPMEIPLYGKVSFREIIKEDLLALWRDIIQETGLEIRSKEKVESVEKPNGFFKVRSTKDEYLTKSVLLAIGRTGTPRKLGVPGENSSKVVYRLLEPEQYAHKKVLVVGGGDSAVEAALSLSEQKGTIVVLSYRRNVFGRIKEKNEQRIGEAVKNGRVHVLFESNVTEILQEKVYLKQKEKRISIANDFVFIFAGGVLPTQFLKDMGISIVKKFGER